MEATPVSVETTPSAGNFAGELSHDVGPRRLGGTRYLLNAVTVAGSRVFGFLSLVVGLSILATIPIVQFLSLGYLLEASGRVAKTGRFRDGMIGLRRASRIGSIALGTWIVFWPARAVSGLRHSSYLLNGDDVTTQRWTIAMMLVVVLTIGHVVWAWFRGGRLVHFLWPAPVRFWRRLRAGGMYASARDATWQFLQDLRLPYYWLLGLKGFLGAAVWLFLPVSLMVLSSRLPVPIGVFAGFIGAIWLATVLIYLPFLQAQFAASGQFWTMFDLAAVRRSFRRAPIAFWVALLITLAFALPLYLLKAELVPREAAWLPSLVFVLFIYPARLLTGWSIARAQRCDLPRHWVFRWGSRLAMIPVVGFYVLMVYITQYISWYGALSLYEQHAFMLPVPFWSGG